MLTESLVFLIVAAISYLIWNRREAMKLRDKMGVPGPKPHLFFGNMNQIFADNEKTKDHPMMIVREWRKIYGNIFGYYFGTHLNIALCDVELAKEVLIKKFDCFIDRMHFVLTDTYPIMNDSLFFAKGEKWKQFRNTLTPTFTASKMKQMSSTVHDKIDTMINILGNFADKNETFDIYDVFQALTLDVIGQIAFALKVNCQTDPKDPFLLNSQKFFREADVKRSTLTQLAILFPELDVIFTKFRHLTGFGRPEAWLLNALRKVLDERKKNFQETQSVDVLQLLMDAQKKQKETNADQSKKQLNNYEFTDDAIIGNAFAFLVAGYETTSTALAFTAWLLAKHQDVQAKLQKEIDEKISPQDTVNYDVMHKLPYLDAVFHESLRIYPPVVQFVNRTCVKECDIGPVHFYPGVQAFIPIREFHNDPEMWPEPEKFDPERFLNVTQTQLSWMPFGSGQRNCIGMRFADMEFKMALVSILQKFTLVFAPQSENPLQTCEITLLLRPKNGVKVRAVRREMGLK